jgi:hypothetical protein
MENSDPDSPSSIGGGPFSGSEEGGDVLIESGGNDSGSKNEARNSLNSS